MKFDNIEKPSFLYSFLYIYAKFVFDKIFYKKVVYTGVENVPKDKPVLIAPNHQNALMDALAIIFASDRRVIFLARSDIFQNPIVANILIFLRILPVYRIRDGKEKLKLNEIIYNKTIDILEKHHPLSIFPEATHNDKMRLREFKKGVQRVTLMTQDKNNNETDVLIIPTGIYYSNYFNIRSVLQVNFGKPIHVSEYYQQFKETEARSMVILGNEMFKRVQELMIDVRDEENYDVYLEMLSIYDKTFAAKKGINKLKQADKFLIDKETIQKTENISSTEPEKFKLLTEKVRNYSAGIRKFGLRDWVLEKPFGIGSKIFKSIILILGFPFLLAGFIPNAIPYLMPLLITHKLKDRQFISSIRYAMGLILFPIYYLFVYVVISLISGFWLWTLASFILFPAIGLLAFGYHRFFVKFAAQMRFSLYKNSSEMKEIVKLRKEIIEIMN
jgi:1-acyl-sn-glycerol-3-phosphate acyltransferase